MGSDHWDFEGGTELSTSGGDAQCFARKKYEKSDSSSTADGDLFMRLP